MHFDVAVVEVLRPAGDPYGARGVLCEGAEADALHAARDHKTAGGRCSCPLILPSLPML